MALLEHDPEKWIPVFGKACPRARPGGSCSNNKVERDDDSKKSHLAPVRLRKAMTGRRQNPPPGPVEDSNVARSMADHARRIVYGTLWLAMCIGVTPANPVFAAVQD